ncbi:MAG TPA: hypothetical protein VN372_00130 [Methanospirillum sp.]|nr:hypothetical protein [Methanospirillum sp.]
MTVFQNLITDIITDNPCGCVDYVSNGTTIDGCLKGTERYSGIVVYENALAKTVGQISVTANTSAGFNTDISTILGTVALNTAMGVLHPMTVQRMGSAFRSSAITRMGKNIPFGKT